MSHRIRPAVTLLGCLLLILACSCPSPGKGPEPALLREERMLMGTRFEIQIVDLEGKAGVDAVERAFAEVVRIEELLSEWRETSEISEVNRQAGSRPVTVGPELMTVLQRSMWASEKTHGAFDVTFAACGGLWSFVERRRPDARSLSRCLDNVGYGRVQLDAARSTVFLPMPGMRIGIAGIGKGYGVDRAAEVLEAHGITNYIVDGGGDIRLRGKRLDRPWKVGIHHPRRPGSLYATLSLDRGAIVSSGDYERFFESEGVRYHHILDPASGTPARNSIAVTVVAPNAMDADALATGLFVLGAERGLALVEDLPDVEALFFDPQMKVRHSSGFPPYEGVEEAERGP